MVGKRVLAGLEAEATGLLECALSCPALVPRRTLKHERFKRERDVTAAMALREQRRDDALAAAATSRAAQNARAEEEEDLSAASASASTSALGKRRRRMTPLDAIEQEERLRRSIQRLKEQLFDATVEEQQMRTVLERLKLSKVATHEAVKEVEAQSRGQGQGQGQGQGDDSRPVDECPRFQERDLLASNVLRLFNELQTVHSEDKMLEREVRRKQLLAKTRWEEWNRSHKSDSASEEGEEADSEAGRRKRTKSKIKPKDVRRTTEHNAWLQHVLTTMVLEAKVPWAADDDVRKLIMMD